MSVIFVGPPARCVCSHGTSFQAPGKLMSVILVGLAARCVCGQTDHREVNECNLCEHSRSKLKTYADDMFFMFPSFFK